MDTPEFVTLNAAKGRSSVWLLLALLLACAGCSSGIASPGQKDTVALRGADVSALERIEQAGGVFRDNHPGDAIAILRVHGSNVFRLRLFVNPNHTPGAPVAGKPWPRTGPR